MDEEADKVNEAVASNKKRDSSESSMEASIPGTSDTKKRRKRNSTQDSGLSSSVEEKSRKEKKSESINESSPETPSATDSGKQSMEETSPASSVDPENDKEKGGESSGESYHSLLDHMRKVGPTSGDENAEHFASMLADSRSSSETGGPDSVADNEELRNDDSLPQLANDDDTSDSGSAVGFIHVSTLAFEDDMMLVGRQALDAEMSDSGGDTEEESPEKWTRPKHRWNALKALRQRECGNARRTTNESFRYAAMGAQRMVEKMELLHLLENHNGCVNCLNFNSSGSRLASGSDDTNVTIWDWARNKSLIQFDTGHRLNVFQAKFMPLSGDCHIVTCARDGQVRLAELSVRGICKSTRKLAQHRGSAHKIALERESPHTVLTCGEDGLVYEIDLREPKANKLLTCHKDGVGSAKVALYSIDSNPSNPDFFVVSGRDPYCRVYDKRMVRQDEAGSGVYRKYCPHHLVDAEWKPNVTCVVYNYDGSELLATYNDDDIYTFNTQHSDGADYSHRFTGHRNNATVKGVNYFGPHSEFVVSGSDCGYIYFWEKESQRIINFLHGDEGGVVNVLEPHPTASVLATSGLDHDVKVWIPTANEPVFDVEKLKKLVKKNEKLRSRDRMSVNDPEYDSEMFFMVMSRMMRRFPRRQLVGEQNSSDEESEDTEEETEPPLHCRTS